MLDFKKQGFMPEGVINYLALLGWAPDETTTIMSREEMVERFELEKVSKADAVFDYDKLEWLNGHYIRSLPEQTVIQRAVNFLVENGYDLSKRHFKKTEECIRLEIPRVKTFAEMADHMNYFLNDEIEYDEKAVKKHVKKGKAAYYLKQTAEALEGVDEFKQEPLEHAMKALIERLEIKFGKIAQPLRVALTGRSASPGIFDVLILLGKDRTLQRIHHTLETHAPPEE